jgi:peptidoglycan/LPS O-acetylase OafA/YrhL
MRWNVGLERLFPPVIALTILMLAANEARWGSAARRLGTLGDISYGIYLWHFPLQLAFVLSASWAAAGADFFYRGSTFAAFIASLLAVSFVSFRYLEAPAKDTIRRRFQASHRQPKPT